jgi:ketosteroid isomerase-like protein
MLSMRALISFVLLGVSATGIFGQEAAPPADPGSQEAAVTPSAEASRALVMRFYEEAWQRGDFEIADQLFAPDYVYHGEGEPVSPGPSHGDIIRRAHEALENLEVAVDHILVEGDLVAVRSRLRFSPHGLALLVWRLAGNDLPINVNAASVFRVENGRITEMWTTSDGVTRCVETGIVQVYAIGGLLSGLLLALLGLWVVRRIRRPWIPTG